MYEIRAGKVVEHPTGPDHNRTERDMADNYNTPLPKLTKEQAAVIGAFTGFAIGPFSDVHEYAERVLGRPIFTHEFADLTIANKLREAAKSDFVSMAYEEDAA